ncbi:transposase domain-containing protein [Streptosporangium sp. NPDC023615]|uniref:transposase domain-containing protein n=1 Tax=Streptosporangium sp. NPDC023615 TaxID=3154794 RepID=UPI003449E0FE
MKTEPVDGRLADHLSIALLTSAFPVPLLDEVILISGCADRRRRALPARLTIYYVLALCVFPDRNYDEIMRLLLNGLSWRSRWARSWEPPSASAISRARARLGAEPLRVLFGRMARPPEPGAPGPVPSPRNAPEQGAGNGRGPGRHDGPARGAGPAGLRLVSVDGATLTVPETRDNAAFGYPDEAARFPCVRVTAMADGRTHALVDATIGASGSGRHGLAPRLLAHLGPGTLLLAGPGSGGAGLWRQASRTGAHLLCGAGGTAGLPVARLLGDGSFLSRPPGWTGTPLRVVPLPGLPGLPGLPAGTGRLVTTLTDPRRAPAPDLAAWYARRWVMDGALAWLRSDRSGAAVALRSRTPETVTQEVWALLCVYQAVRALACPGAERAPAPPAPGWPAPRARAGGRAGGVAGAGSLRGFGGLRG